MKIKTLVFVGIYLSASVGMFAQQVRQDVGTRLLIPSSARTGSFTSFLAVTNLDTQPNTVTVTARREDGSVIGQLSRTLSVGGRFRSVNILGEMGAGIPEFGPITVESTNGRILSAVSEVVSAQGPGGFFPGINTATAWQTGFISEVIDTGDGGNPGTFRTNIGINTVGSSGANITVTLHDNSGTQMGVPISFFVAGNGMTQRNGVVRDLLNSGGGVTGQNGYLRITSNQPVVAWASKIENGTGDPSFQIGIGAASIVTSQIEAGTSDIRNNLLFIALGLLGPAAVFLAQRLPKAGPGLPAPVAETL
ncbi:MAG: hypothetical protein L0387_22560 [Acidobacteria bacterium]|nr:hypothetical protein [Acidobacteriota bacterium]MCI0624391.1 hypothetical protein [Acidobacteriota bacterium]MCI0723466.1 hypothetical protein [Acidobacteriota bacterium]